MRAAHVPELDGLRGVSILAVMAFHAGAPFMPGGFIGVDLFFVLSGFLITSLLLREKDGSGSIDLPSFYARRVLRLAPALGALVAVYCLVTFAVLHGEAARTNYVDALIALFYLSNWASAFSVHPPFYLGHTWSLSIEEQFYLLWPATVALVLRAPGRRRTLAVAAAALAALSCGLRIYLSWAGAPPERLYYGLDVRADALMVGCLVGVLLAPGSMRPAVRAALERALAVAAPLAAAGLLGFAVLASRRLPWMHSFGFLAVEVLAAVLVARIAVTAGSPGRRFLATGVLVWIGSISYGLYLWHYPIFRLLREVHFRGTAVTGTLLSFAAAAVSYHALERPALALKKRFERARAPGPPGSPA